MTELEKLIAERDALNEKIEKAKAMYKEPIRFGITELCFIEDDVSFWQVSVQINERQWMPIIRMQSLDAALANMSVLASDLRGLKTAVQNKEELWRTT